ncbi:GyrI-like domain-containing protein [Variovorax ureilyticus]|uniref:GyrI-like domain-containing protein n=1 Tax=Variovorax ureilyticus TaxID=1836198 RepID=UPI003D665D6B
MQPQLQRLDAFSVAGLTARTTNHDENNPQAARISTLWNRFFDERIYEKTPHRIADMHLYGVYSAYETDADGAFDITTGVAVADGPEAVRIEGATTSSSPDRVRCRRWFSRCGRRSGNISMHIPKSSVAIEATSRRTAAPSRSPSTSELNWTDMNPTFGARGKTRRECLADCVRLPRFIGS